MLADDTLLPLDDASNTDKIIEILMIIQRKENKTEEQREVERVAFWTGLLDRYGDRLPIQRAQVMRPRAQKARGGGPGPQTSLAKLWHRFQPRKAARRLAAAALLLAALLLVNTFVAYAFQVNFLSVVVDFTDDLFRIRVVSPPGPAEPPPDNEAYEPVQAALNELGITRLKAPGWMPDGYEFETLEGTDMANNKILMAYYWRGEDVIIMMITYSKESSQRPNYTYEKSPGTPLEYERNGTVHYIFKNLDITVAAWADELCEYSIQGKISVEEIKLIVDSMYKEVTQ